MNQTKLQKGALIVTIEQGSDGVGANPSKQTFTKTIEFQFNPETLSRNLSVKEPGSEGIGGRTGQEAAGTKQDLKTSLVVMESISLNLRFDGKENTGEDGILPVISAIEKLIEPVETPQSQTSPAHQIAPKKLPLCFFVWGNKRVLPVKILEIRVNETEFNPKLNPVTAEVSLSMDVLVPDIMKDPQKSLVNAYKWTAKKKNEQADKYYNNTRVPQPYSDAVA